ncbi:MAG: hypothetical protein CMF99_01310 [Candidatus Marinimicrobia bacterium]|nr:hypothetical protein [Candidatus Neomarinimicrobiota bacterium]
MIPFFVAFQNIQNLYDEYNFIIIFTAGLIPISFKLFTTRAGTFNINFSLFLLSEAIRGSARFFSVGYLIKIMESQSKFLFKNILSDSNLKLN